MTVDQILIALQRSAANDYPLSVSADEALALVAEVERLRAERHFDNADLAQAYDFARNKGEALEREAVVAYLRACDGESYDFADDIERGEHRRKEGL